MWLTRAFDLSLEIEHLAFEILTECPVLNTQCSMLKGEKSAAQQIAVCCDETLRLWQKNPIEIGEILILSFWDFYNLSQNFEMERKYDLQ